MPTHTHTHKYTVRLKAAFACNYKAKTSIKFMPML